jgi:hypothetical protein
MAIGLLVVGCWRMWELGLGIVELWGEQMLGAKVKAEAGGPLSLAMRSRIKKIKNVW